MGFMSFYDSVDALAIGKKTYEQILGFGNWPYPGKLSYIFTRTPMEPQNKDVEFVSDNIPGFIRDLANPHTIKPTNLKPMNEMRNE
jgi:dihydrofolate reductase